MDPNVHERLKLVAVPAYLLGFALFVEPLSDAFFAVWPFRPAVRGWRFGSVGIFSGGLMTPLLALFVVTCTAVVIGHRRVRRVVGWLAAVLCLFLVLITGVFVFDAVGTAPTLEEVEGLSESQFRGTVVRAVVKLALGAAAAGALSWAALRREGSKGKPEPAKQPAS